MALIKPLRKIFYDKVNKFVERRKNDLRLLQY